MSVYYISLTLYDSIRLDTIVVRPCIMTISDVPTSAAPVQRSVLFYALVWSILIHAATFAYFDFDAPRRGQTGLGHYVAARLVDSLLSPAIPPKQSTRRHSTPVQFTVAVVQQSSFKVNVHKHVAKKKKRVKPRPTPAPVRHVQAGNVSAGGGKSSYESLVLKEIDAKKEYPYTAWRNRIEGNVDVDMLVNHDGSATVLMAKSDYPSLADAARAAISRAQPLPVPPGGSASATARIRFSMEFTIRN